MLTWLPPKSASFLFNQIVLPKPFWHRCSRATSNSWFEWVHLAFSCKGDTGRRPIVVVRFLHLRLWVRMWGPCLCPLCLCVPGSMCAVSRHRLSPPSGSCTTLLCAVSTALGLRRYVVYRSQVLCVAKVSGAPACSRGFPRPGWAAGSFPSCCLTPNVTQLKTQQLLYWAFHLFPIVRLL